MRDPLSELRRSGRPGAVATLIAASGAQRRAGASMCVDLDGRIVGSVTIGGCVDARAVEVAEEVLRTGIPQRISLSLGDEDAWAFGMTCAGAVDLLVEPTDMSRDDDAIAGAAAVLAELRAAGRSAVEVFALHGRPARAVVTADGVVHGSLGNEALDRAAGARALAVLDAGVNCVTRVTGTAGPGSSRELFFRLHAPPAVMVVVGATDVAVALAPMARALDFRTVIVDGRDRFATRDRFPDADELRVGMPSEVVDTLTLTPATSLVLLSHDYKYDLPVLESALRAPVGYIGVIGSRRRGRALDAHLMAAGFDAAQRARVRVPIGLDIGARSPSEIALSVLAEIVAVRAARSGGALSGAPSPAEIPPAEVPCAP